MRCPHLASALLLLSMGPACAIGESDEDDDDTDAGHQDAGPDGGGEDAGHDAGPGELRIGGMAPLERAGVAGDELAEPCAVQAMRGILPEADVPIHFEVVSGGGRVSEADVPTGPDGIAATQWTLGFGGRSQVLRASTEGLDPVEFTADVSPREIDFVEPASYPVGAGSTPWDLEVGHFDDDEAPDLVVSLRTDAVIVVLHNDGTGIFDAGRRFDTRANPRGLAVARLDGDDRDDVAVAARTSGRVLVFLGDAEETLVAHSDFLAAGGANDVVAVDFDGDGFLDLATANRGADSVTVLGGDGSGTFGAPVTFVVGNSPTKLVAGDLDDDAVDSDDLVDLVVAEELGDTIGVLLGEEGLDFSPVRTHAVGNGPVGLALGYLDDNATLDAVVANAIADTVVVLPGNGVGGFSDVTEYPMPTGPAELALGEMNGDGAIDIVVTLPGTDQVAILRNDGTGGFGGGVTTIAAGAGARAVVVEDFDGDGMPDLAVANEDGDDVSILIRR